MKCALHVTFLSDMLQAFVCPQITGSLKYNGVSQKDFVARRTIGLVEQCASCSVLPCMNKAAPCCSDILTGLLLLPFAVLAPYDCGVHAARNRVCWVAIDSCSSPVLVNLFGLFDVCK